MTPLHIRAAMNLWALDPGSPCFVEMRNRLYRGIVIRHFPSEHVVQVETEAAKVIHAKWRLMCFRWADGRADASRLDGRLILARDEADMAALNARVEADGEAFRRGVALAHQVAGPQKQRADPQQHWWND